MSLPEAISHMHAAASLPPSGIGEEDRKEALRACEVLRASLESPMEVAMRILFSALPLVAL